MSSKYHLLPEHGLGDADDDVSELLLRENLVSNRKRWWHFLPHSALVTIALVMYSIAICWVTRLALLKFYSPQIPAPASSCKFKAIHVVLAGYDYTDLASPSSR